MTEELKKYELMVILSGDIVESDFEKEVETLRKLLSESTKGISYEDIWGRKDFTYTIKRQKRGYYVVFDFTATPSSLVELRINIKLNQAVLRHLILTLPENYEPGRYKKAPVIDEDFMADRIDKRRKIIKVEEDIMKQEPVASVREKKVEEAGHEDVRTEEAEPKVEAKVAGKEEEEELKTVEKRLEKILENPDLDIK